MARRLKPRLLEVGKGYLHSYIELKGNRIRLALRAYDGLSQHDES